jgi:hypothetical protein
MQYNPVYPIAGIAWAPGLGAQQQQQPQYHPLRVPINFNPPRPKRTLAVKRRRIRCVRGGLILLGAAQALVLMFLMWGPLNLQANLTDYNSHSTELTPAEYIALAVLHQPASAAMRQRDVFAKAAMVLGTSLFLSIAIGLLLESALHEKREEEQQLYGMA